MSFFVMIPARLKAQRLPDKPLADLGGKPMVVRVAERAQLSGAERVIVATDDVSILAACHTHGIDAYLTRTDHPSGTDRIAEVAAALQLPDDAIVVNVQGDEPLIDPDLIRAVALRIAPDVPMATAAHPIAEIRECFNPNVVKVVLNAAGCALYFSRAPIPWHREDFSLPQVGASSAFLALPTTFPAGYAPLRHIGLYAYRADFLQRYATLTPSPLEKIESLEQLRVLWHGVSIAVHIAETPPAAGVDTPEDLQRVQQFFAQRNIES